MAKPTKVAKAAKTILTDAPQVSVKELVKILGVEEFNKLSQVEKTKRIALSKEKKFGNFPDLLQAQKKGYQEFIDIYIHKLFEDVNPIQDIAGEKLFLTIDDVKVETATQDIDMCKKKELTYGGIITGRIKLSDSASKKVLFNKRVNIGILPLMTQSGSYIISGIERVIISQIVRSYGIFYNYDKKELKHSFKMIPEKGSWFQVLAEKNGNIVARINKSRKFSATALLRILGFETDESISETFKNIFEEEDFNYISRSLEKDPTIDALSAAVYIYGKIRPGEIVDPENALDYIRSLFLSNTRIHVGRVARRKINAKLNLNKKLDDPISNIFEGDDLVAAMKYLISFANNKKGFYEDDNDHLSNKRVRTMGEILYSHLQPVMQKFIKSVKGKLSILNLEEQIKLTDLVNFKMIDNAIKSFFATSQLSQFLDQTNPLSEIEHKRRITALGPGGLKRETAKFEVRDVHPSHYGRICPIETPEGQNIGLVIYQSLYSLINEEGFIETQALKVKNEVAVKKSLLVGKIAHKDIVELDKKGNKTEKIIVKTGDIIDSKAAEKIETIYGAKGNTIKVRPFLTDEVENISPENDEKYYIADAASEIDENGNLRQNRLAGRHYTDMEEFYSDVISHVDVNPSQIFSPNTSLIPFVDHNDAVRASMGTNQQKQATPLIKDDAPLVGTGLESDIAAMSYATIKAEGDGEVIYIDGKRIKVKYSSGTKEYEIIAFKKSNQKTIIHQRATVSLGQKVKKGDTLAEGPSIVNGEIALGKNLRVAFVPWEGFNYEDAIVISQAVVKNDKLTSIHIEEYEIEVADTKLGPEETTNDIPGVSLSKLKNLDEEGIIRIGSTVKGGDILVGKITPKSEGELSPEEKLIQAVFGDKSKSMKDTSLYLPAGSEGKIIDIVVLDSKKGDNLLAGVKKKIKVYVAMTRKIEVGDKLAGRHGNKGIIALVVPEEDMPVTADGQPIEIILNPLGVISRMNVGQIYETQLGLIAKALGVTFTVPLFSNFGSEDMRNILTKLDISHELKMDLFDGKTGEKFENKITVGYMHILKLIHMVEDKIHARSVGPYSLITQQPLGGKARDGGQRFGEMEVWALEAYSAVYTLQEMLTIKSDDVLGRNKTYESIVKGFKPHIGGIPESFNLVTYLFKGLGQNIAPLNQEEIDRIHNERINKIKKLSLKGISYKDSIEEILGGESDLDEPRIDDKSEIIDNVIEELKIHGSMDN
ncbi:MAG TPA: hypothetical protein PKD96_00405 [Candidatus Absconditabacterales bacterium]|nr:hypothetical protein [Candidatus Absconditabacterales bacterium]